MDIRYNFVTKTSKESSSIRKNREKETILQ